MRIPFLLLAILQLTVPPSISGQNVYRFQEGLAVSSASRYGREAIYMDMLAWKLFNNDLPTPKANGFFHITENGDTLRWRKMQADTAGRFRPIRGNWGQGVSSFGNPGRVDRGGDYLYLTYQSEKQRTALVHITGNSAVYINKLPHTGDPYSSGYLYIPVLLKEGLNEFYVRGTSVMPELLFPDKPIMLNTEDPTLPIIVPEMDKGLFKGAVVLLNTTAKELKGYRLKAVIGGIETISTVPNIPARSSRKIIFDFSSDGITAPGKYDCILTVSLRGKAIDTKSLKIESVKIADQYSRTFISHIDSSLQYYSVTPQLGGLQPGAALFLSVHGAGVEAIGQARAYKSKDWGTLVAATNRRPRGFNWEDWGRLDALEVLALSKSIFEPDPAKIYLTGHSMGGHGTWFLGATYPDKWAAIAPCAGYPTLKEYGSADGLVPAGSRWPMEQLLLRAGNQSDVLKLVNNYRPLGIYIHHGDADRTVPVRYARQMRTELAKFHPDFSYYEYPGGSHWFGNESVDWDPLFDYFKWHRIPADSTVDVIDFTTASPGISSSYHWAGVEQQINPYLYSRIRLNRNRGEKSITGKTENVHLMMLRLAGFKVGETVNITIDSVKTVSYKTTTTSDSLYLRKSNGQWILATEPGSSEKKPARYGSFKEAFNHNMVFVYATKGSAEENEISYAKVIFDAETWYYRGNGAVTIVSDKEFKPEHYRGRNTILYGNASTNLAWKMLLNDCPVKVEKNRIAVGTKSWQGDDLAAYFVWPQKDGVTFVGAVGASGVKGMQAAFANQYFAGASGFPDFMIFNLDILKTGAGGVKSAGFFNNSWQLAGDDYL